MISADGGATTGAAEPPSGLEEIWNRTAQLAGGTGTYLGKSADGTRWMLTANHVKDNSGVIATTDGGGIALSYAGTARVLKNPDGSDADLRLVAVSVSGEGAAYLDALGDIGRIQRQQQFLKAMLKKAYDPRVIIRLPELAAQAMKIFRTDMSTSFALQLAGFIQNEVGRDKMLFSTLRGTPATIDGLSYWMGDVRDAKRFLNAPFEELTGEKTEAGEGGAGEQQPAEDEKAEKPGMTAEQLAELVKSMPESVAVLNGTGKSGVAGEISTRLQKIGVDVVHTGNAKHFDYRYSNIVYPSDAPASVKDTAKTLGKLLRIPEGLVRPGQQAFYASLVAGHDYNRLVTLLDELVKISGEH